LPVARDDRLQSPRNIVVLSRVALIDQLVADRRPRAIDYPSQTVERSAIFLISGAADEERARSAILVVGLNSPDGKSQSLRSYVCDHPCPTTLLDTPGL
jgi:hypothetical protein